MILDTNVLIDYPEVILNVDSPVIPYCVLKELDSLKRDRSLAPIIKDTQKILLQYIDSYTTCNFDSDIYVDDQLIKLALESKDSICTSDILLTIKCKKLGIEVLNYRPARLNLKGWRELELTDDQLAEFYITRKLPDARVNEYIILKHNGKYIDTLKGIDNAGDIMYMPVPKRNIKTRMFGSIKPKDVYQDFAIDSLYSDKFTVLTGKAGTAKSLLSLSYCMDMLEKRMYNKLVIFFNPVPVRGTKEIGFYSGDKIEKLLQTNIGSVLSSKFGGIEAVEELIHRGLLEVQLVSECRGVEVKSDEILYFTEAQNLSPDLVKLIIQRSQESKIILEGDIDTQVDINMKTNGLLRTIEVFGGESIFSNVNLENDYRSRACKIADKI